ncbi:MAG: single-stranded-DNA-specific exonuclease RecJ [Pseudomonadota bacterium]
MNSIQNTLWQEKIYNESLANYIMQKYNTSYIASKLISSRLTSKQNISLDTSNQDNLHHLDASNQNQSLNFDLNKKIENFLYPKIQNLLTDIYHLKDLKKAINLIIQAIQQKQTICIYGDYDVDGASATSLLSLFFKDLKVKTNLYIPDRLSEGYGLNITAINKIAQQKNDIIIAVDNGSTAFEQIKHANKLNIQVIVLDHHITEDKLPNALIINPNRLDQISPYKNLCATGVTWIFCVALRSAIEQYINIPKSKLLEYLDIVALATVCDVMELSELNRFFVQYGIEIMNHPTKGNKGIKNLLNLINEKASAGTIGFKLGAMINAGSRLENSYLATKLLTNDDLKIANQLFNLNETRKEIENKIYIDAYQQALQNRHKRIIIIHSDIWHIGVIGIIASRIMEEFNKPCIIISYIEKIGVGSCRSIQQINIGNIIINAKNKKLILEGGGHHMAAGFKIDKKMHNEFTNYIDNNSPQIIQSNKQYDLTIDLTSINLMLLQQLNILEPYGNGNKTPVFLIQNITCKNIKILKNMHVMCILDNNINAFAFRSINNSIGHFLIANSKNIYKEKFHIIGTLSQFNGKISIIIIDVIKDFKNQ